MNTAIIVAAGSGSRFGSEVPKQFLEIAGKPLLFHTIQKFESCSNVHDIVLVISADQMSTYRQLAVIHRPRKVGKIVFGGQTRAESVQKGLAVIDNPMAEIVAVHDGARPFVTELEISATIAKARETGAACLVAPVVDTVKRLSRGKIVETIDRTDLRRALTPQAFHIEILRSAINGADLSDAATDECYLLEQLGYTISTVEGSPRNIKITTPEDWEVAKFIFGQHSGEAVS